MSSFFFNFDFEKGLYYLVLAGLELRSVHQASLQPSSCLCLLNTVITKNEPAFPDAVRPFRKVLRTKKARGPLKVSLVFMKEVTGKGDVSWELWIPQNPLSGLLIRTLS